MQKINFYIAELMIIFAFIYKKLEKEGIVMKRMMKSKILATALCATVMAGIYASPVMAEKLYYGKVGKSVYVSGLEGKINAESLIRQKADQKLADKIGQEEADRKAADDSIRGEIGQEVADRAQADQKLADKIGQEEAEPKAADDSIRGEIGQEAANRANADAELDKKIGDEADARIDADNKLSDRIDANKTAIENEVKAREDADKALRNDLNQETIDRVDADNRLQTAIDQKADKTTVAENTAAIESNKSAIAQEKKDREHADQKLQDQITINKGQIANEATNRANEDKRIEAKFDGEVSRVDGRIDTEVADRKAEVSRLDGRIDKLNDNVQKVGAMAAAIANLHTMGYDPEAPTEIAVGVGQYRDKTGLALGAFHYPNRDFMLSFNVSTAGDEFMGGIGATWKFGRKSPEELRQAEAEKAAKAKLAKAEAAKKAAKDARVAAQQKRHAEMLAARTGK